MGDKRSGLGRAIVAAATAPPVAVCIIVAVGSARIGYSCLAFGVGGSTGGENAGVEIMTLAAIGAGLFLVALAMAALAFGGRSARAAWQAAGGSSPTLR